MKSILLLTAMFGICATLPARIVEDLNRHGWTLLYSLSDRGLEQKKCLAGASPTLELRRCASHGRPLDARQFERALRSAYAEESGKLEAESASLEDVVKTGQRELAGLKAFIAQLEVLIPKPLPRLKTLAAQYREMEERTNQAQSQQRKNHADRAIARSLFEIAGPLRDETLHVFTGNETPSAPGTFAIAHFDTIFSRLLGQRYGKNAWWDRASERVWFIDPTARTWWEASHSCPNGYALISPEANWNMMESSLKRLTDAYENGETGFQKPPLSFWGWQVSANLLGGSQPLAYEFRPWASTPVARDYLPNTHPVMCLSRQAMP